jgi:hypothetical protein
VGGASENRPEIGTGTGRPGTPTKSVPDVEEQKERSLQVLRKDNKVLRVPRTENPENIYAIF